MKYVVISLAVLFVNSAGTVRQPVAAQSSEGRAPKKVQRQILEVESQLKKALATCDSGSLDRLLADYYADSFGDNETAISKQRTIRTCESGAAPYYSVLKDRTITVQGALVSVSGISRIKPRASHSIVDADAKGESEIQVKRTWTKTNGRWQLISQWSGPLKELDR